MAEIEIGVLIEQCLADRIPDDETLCSKTTAWQKARNDRQTTVNWQFTSTDARTKLKRRYPIISRSG